jgi:flagellar hook protein FlgE
MLGAIYIGLGGMNAYTQGLQTVSNNVANLNTAGFKATSVTFSDLFSVGGSGLTFTGNGSSETKGSGVAVGSKFLDLSEGELRESVNDLDLAIQGSGFLVLFNNGTTYYSRTGQFVVDKDGYISEQGSSGYRLAVLDAQGRPVAVNIDAKRTSAPAATTKIVFTDNLSSSGSEDTVSDIAVFDSRGGTHSWTASFAKNADTPNAWNVTVKDGTDKTVGTSTLKFIGSAVDPTTATFTAFDSPDGADDLSVTLDFSGVTSFSAGSVSTLRTSSVDGDGVGSLTTVILDDTGKIKLTYSNGKTDLLGAVAIADFRDPQELKQVGDGHFRDTGTGEKRYLPSATEGVGTLLSKKIEASNVNLTQEFGDLILIQRGFQACSQVVSVSNDMIQQLFGIRGQG